MAKTKSNFECVECGYTSPKWLGKCPRCSNWNTFVEIEEEKTSKSIKPIALNSSSSEEAVILSHIDEQSTNRIMLQNTEMNRVLGGGIMPASVILLAGDPGIGKSTLLLQTLGELTEKSHSVLYVSGEESKYQIKARANRIGVKQDTLYLLTETSLSHIMQCVEKMKPDFIAIDSIQTIYKDTHTSVAGSVPQIRECTNELIHYAKTNNCAIFLVGHVTKEGALAGPKILEHMVDVVLYFEGDKQHEFRLLRAIKNRFGSVNELGVFEMTEQGMNSIDNPSATLLSHRASNISGSIVFCTLHGSRPLLVDLQALTMKSYLAMPRRLAHGIEQSKISLLLAIIEKRANKKMYDQDVYVNVSGGIDIDDPAADLAIILAIVSSHENITFPQHFTALGEVGLCGEVRPVTQLQRRINECERLGYNHIMVPKCMKSKLTIKDGLKVSYVDTIFQAISLISTK